MNTNQIEFLNQSEDYDEDMSTPPLLAKKHGSENADYLRLYQADTKCWCRGFYDSYLPSKEGYLLIFSTKYSQEFLYFFEPAEFSEALDFFNKLAEGIGHSNDLMVD